MGQGEFKDKPMTIRGRINKFCIFPSAAVKLILFSWSFLQPFV